MKKSAFLVVLALAFAMISYANVFAAETKPAAKQEAKSDKKSEHKKHKHNKEAKSSQGTK